MVFQVLSVLVPALLFVILPRLLRTGKAEKQVRPLLYIAGAMFFISYYLQSPIIDGMDTHFWTHFVGGGLFCAVLWEYIRRSMQLKQSLLERGAATFALTSTLGVTNELAEFVFVKTGIAHITLDDTTWDLVANTLGCIVGFIVVYILGEIYDSRH